MLSAIGLPAGRGLKPVQGSRRPRLICSSDRLTNRSRIEQLFGYELRCSVRRIATRLPAGRGLKQTYPRPAGTENRQGRPGNAGPSLPGTMPSSLGSNERNRPPAFGDTLRNQARLRSIRLADGKACHAGILAKGLIAGMRLINLYPGVNKPLGRRQMDGLGRFQSPAPGKCIPHQPLRPLANLGLALDEDDSRISPKAVNQILYCRVQQPASLLNPAERHLDRAHYQDVNSHVAAGQQRFQDRQYTAVPLT